MVLAGSLVALTACSSDLHPAPTPSGIASHPLPSSLPSRTVRPSVSAAPAVVLPEPGRPWDAEDLLADMAASSRPDGVPAELQTVAVADALAEVIWTVDGRAWDTFAIGGFCGTTSCTLELAGTHLGRAGEDLWVLDIVPETAAVAVTEATLRSLPVDLVERLDALARELVEVPADAALATARWLPPPAEPGHFRLSYRSGGEEGSCAVDLTLDAPSATVVEQTSTDC